MKRRLTDLARTLGKRLADDRGSVAILVSLVIFICCGLLTMTWNTALLSKEKMRVQNAADSAALEHALWQARGLNALQNINDEAYAASRTAAFFLDSAADLAAEAEALGKIPETAPLATYLYVGEIALGSTSAIIDKGALGLSLQAAGVFYANTSCAIGFRGAQAFAATNGASALYELRIDGRAGDWAENLIKKLIGADRLSICAIPVSLSKDVLFLPVVRDKDAPAPFHRKNQAQRELIEKSKPGSFLKTLGCGKDFDFSPWVSPSNTVNGTCVYTYPKPTTWAALRFSKATPLASLTAWAQRKESQRGTALENMPTIAVAAAQCVTGNVVPCNTKLDKTALGRRKNWLAMTPAERRPAGFGTGATAKLVPVADSMRAMLSGLGTVTEFIVWH